MDFEDVIILGLLGFAGYWLYQQRLAVPVAAPVTPVTVAQSNAPNATPISSPMIPSTPASTVAANGTPCSIAPSCTPGQPCSALRIGGTMMNGVCGPVTLTGLGRYR
jgi:hypothetical protein